MISKVLLLPAFALTLALTLAPMVSATGLPPASTSAAATPASTRAVNIAHSADASAPAQRAPAPLGAARTVTLTYLKAQPGRLAQLERYVRANWFAMDAEAVRQGLFVNYEWLDTASDDGAWNAIVRVTYGDDKGFEGIEQRWAPIRAAHKEVRPDDLGMKDLGQVLETKTVFERVPFAAKPPAPAANQQTAQTASSPETTAVRAAVEAYFRAADSGEADRVRSTFLPNARVEGVLGGKFVSWTADNFATRNFRGQPPDYAATVQRSFEWLDVSGPAAIARVKVTIDPANVYFDYFSLFKVDGQWKIGLKAFANPDPG